jgi:arylsulfatase A-like enzyme
VFVLTDDLSWNLVRFMPQVKAMMAAGMTFRNFTVTDSECCPSRASLFTGEYPHNTQVAENFPPYGGYAKFEEVGDESRSFAVALQAAGVTTGFAGKYLNGYGADDASTDGSPNNPPGWDVWGAMDGGGYNGFNYEMILNNSVVSYGTSPQDYTNTVLRGFGRDFLTTAIAASKPFFLELATFSPHYPDVPAPRDAHSFTDLNLPRGPAFNRHPTSAPPWLANLSLVTPAQILRMRAEFQHRVQSIQSVDRMIGALRDRLAQAGVLQNTVFVFSSDNGLHMGDYGLYGGKYTAFDTDVEVPLIVTGPGIPANTIDRHLVQMVDLAPTFEALTGAHIPNTVDGRSMVGLLEGRKVPWRTFGLIEHFQPPAGTDNRAVDPDFQVPIEANPPSYEALRTPTFTYVRYVDGEREFYDRTTDPYELHNTYRQLTPLRGQYLDGRVKALQTCVGMVQCWTEARPSLRAG